MRTKKAAIEYARKYLRDVIKHNVKIDKAYLFGSYVKGTQSETSDIDVALVSSDFTGDRFENWKRLSSANIKFHQVEPHLFTIADFENKKSFLREEVLPDAVEIKIN